MAVGNDDGKDTDNSEQARNEYELAVKTQMHFNEILMKFRSFGITVVVAVYSYAVTRPSSEVITAIAATPSQVIAVAGVILTVLFAVIDLGYFFPLLLGAVGRGLALEQSTPYRLTSAISDAVSKKRAYTLIITFYAAIALSGAVLSFAILPTSEHPVKVGSGQDALPNPYQHGTSNQPGILPNTTFQGDGAR